jgi:hypothetical protein
VGFGGSKVRVKEFKLVSGCLWDLRLKQVGRPRKFDQVESQVRHLKLMIILEKV